MARFIGVISDTHGLLRPQAKAALAGSELIIHGGDIGRANVLEELRELAPVYAVKGNIDGAGWADPLPQSDTVIIENYRLYVLHNLKELDLKPAPPGVDAVISGHSHRPANEARAGVLYFNPGSAGPRRFKLPVTVGRIRFARGGLRGEIITLE